MNLPTIEDLDDWIEEHFGHCGAVNAAVRLALFPVAVLLLIAEVLFRE